MIAGRTRLAALAILIACVTTVAQAQIAIPDYVVVSFPHLAGEKEYSIRSVYLPGKFTLSIGTSDVPQTTRISIRGKFTDEESKKLANPSGGIVNPQNNIVLVALTKKGKIVE